MAQQLSPLSKNSSKKQLTDAFIAQGSFTPEKSSNRSQFLMTTASAMSTTTKPHLKSSDEVLHPITSTVERQQMLTDDSEAETEVAEEDAQTSKYGVATAAADDDDDDDDDDEEARFWDQYKMPRRNRNHKESHSNRQRYTSSSSSSSGSSAFEHACDDSDDNASQQQDDGDEDNWEDEVGASTNDHNRIDRKRKLGSSTRYRSSRRHVPTEQPSYKARPVAPEKRRRGRPRKESSAESQDLLALLSPEQEQLTSEKLSNSNGTRKKPKGRIACQDPNKPDKAGRTKLFVFTGSGNLDKVKEFVERGANVNHRDNAGWTPLHEASLKGQKEIAAYLISKGADVNARGFNDDTPLHDASSNGFPDCVQLLVDAGADVFALNSDKETPLDVCDDDDGDLSRKILTDKVKQLNRLVAVDEKSGRTILHHACASGDYERVALLLKQGANANACDKDSCTPLLDAAHQGHTRISQLLIQHGADINYVDKKGNTALHHASKEGHTGLVSYLLDAGADVDHCNGGGESAYNVATDVETRRILAARIDELRKQRTASDAIDEITFISHTKQRRRQPGEQKQQQQQQKSRPLTREERKIQSIMRTFDSIEQNKRPRRPKIRVNDDEDAEENLPSSPKGYATTTAQRKRRGAAFCGGRKRQTSLSTEVDSSREPSLDPDARPSPSKRTVDPNKLDPQKKDTSGRTHLHKWAIKGDVSVVQALLKAGANSNESDNAGWTPLHEAALRGRDQVVLMLLENGANPNSKGADQDTALHDAVENGHVQVIGHLLRFGASPRARNAKGVTPLDIAVENGEESIERLLRRAMVKDGKRKVNSHVPNDEPRKRAKEDKQRSPVSHRLSKLTSGDQEHQQRSPPPRARVPEVSGRHPPKKAMQSLQQQHEQEQPSQPAGDVSPDGPHTPIPTPPPEHWQTKVKEEKDYNALSSLLLAGQTASDTRPSVAASTNSSARNLHNRQHPTIKSECQPSMGRSLSEAQRYLPLYTVQLFDDASEKYSFFVVDFQVSMLLGLSSGTFWLRYPHLYRRMVTAKEKDRLWSPFSTMICPPYHQEEKNFAPKEVEKRRFTDAVMYFVLLEQVVAMIKQDYSHLSQSLITITLDIGYKDDQQRKHDTAAGAPLPALPPTAVTTDSPPTPSAILPPTMASTPKRPGCALPPKFAMKLQKLKK